MSDTNDILKAMLARRAGVIATIAPIATEIEPLIEPIAPDIVPDENPPFDAFTENVSYHWRRLELAAKVVKKPALRPERAVLQSIKTWLKKINYFRVKRVSVGMMRTAQGVVMGFGGVKGESDIIITPDAGQPFERQVHVEVKRPDVMVDGRNVQRAGVQSLDQKAYQAMVESKGDRYVCVTSAEELRAFLEDLGFRGLPNAPKRGKYA